MADMPMDPAVNTGGEVESFSKMNDEIDPETGPKTAAGWKTDNVSVRKAENGGFIATCSKSRESTGKDDYASTYQSKDYAFTSIEEALSYLAQELGGSAPSSGRGNQVLPAPGYRG